MNDVIELLRELVNSGEFGIIIISLIAIIGGGALLIWLQRQVLSQIDAKVKSAELNINSTVKSIELSMKAADTEREQSKIFQNEVKQGIQQQYDVVIATNKELREELSRIKNQQSKFEADVKKAISLGLTEIKLSLSQITVKELLEQIPNTFKKDLERELNQMVTNTINSFGDRLRNTQTKEGSIETIINSAVNSALQEFERNIPYILRQAEERIQQTFGGIIDPQLREEISYYIRRGDGVPPELLFRILHITDPRERDEIEWYYRNHRTIPPELLHRYPGWASLLVREDVLDILAEKIAYKLRRY